MKRMLKAVVMLLLIAMVFASTIYALDANLNGNRIKLPDPTVTLYGSTASCKVKLKYPGQTIDATLELTQGSNVIASWSGNATGSLTLSGNATVQTGVTYTLTVSGTLNSNSATPASITFTP